MAVVWPEWPVLLVSVVQAADEVISEELCENSP